MSPIYAKLRRLSNMEPKLRPARKGHCVRKNSPGADAALNKWNIELVQQQCALHCGLSSKIRYLARDLTEPFTVTSGGYLRTKNKVTEDAAMVSFGYESVSGSRHRLPPRVGLSEVFENIALEDSRPRWQTKAAR